jgi:hypothetical protein
VPARPRLWHRGGLLLVFPPEGLSTVRHRWTTSLATGAALSLLLSGCGGGVSPQDWASNVCGSLEGVQTKMTKAGKNVKLDPTDREATRTSVVEFFGVAQTQSKKLASDVEDAGTPDVENGEKDAQRLVDKLEQTATVFGEAQSDLKKADVSTQKSFQKAMTELQAKLQQGSTLSDPTQELKSQELKKALKNNKKCKTAQS